MIPVRLYLRNFMCYRGEGETLDLEGVHLACLAGENGAGKSAILSAMTWALWGKARERISDDDQVMSLGATDMEVEFEFILGDARYLVKRARTRKGTKSFPVLELQMRTDADADTWRPLTGHSILDTEARITKLLKMDYDTFTNSAFILQGRADSFTVKSPSERKEVLAKILGLEQYDRLEERAREESKERKARMAELEVTIKRMDGELLMRPTYAKQLEDLDADLALKQAALTTLKEELQLLISQYESLKGSKQRLLELDARIARREEQITTTEKRLAAKTAERDALLALIARREEIESGYARLLAARDEVGNLREKLDDLTRLEMAKSNISGTINAARAGLESERTHKENQLRDLERRLAGRGEAERQLSEWLVKLRDLERLQQQHEDARCMRETLDLKIRSLTQEKDACEKEGKMLRQKLDMLLETHAEQKSHAGCPLCGTPLSAEALQRVKDSFEADIHARRADYDRTRKELEATNKEFVAISTRIDKEREQLKHLPVAHERKAHYSQQITQMDRDQESLDTARAELAGVKQRLSEQAYAQEERKHLAEVEVEIALLVGVRDQFSASVARRDELQAEKYDERYSELRNADNRLSNLHDDLAIDSSSVAAWRHEQETDRAEKYRLLPEVDKLGEVEGLVYDKRHEENELAGLVQDLLGERGQLVGRIAHCDRLRDEKQQLTQEFKTAEDEKRIYDELVSAFGKKGIQAMIIENVIPEIEEEANSLLFRMTDGRMTVQFATQRDAKSTKSVIETLDINISDEMGTRSYEMYSGGEAYRVNFAVRIALSKLLARRAGAQLQMLVIDEGFGTQDGQGREKLVSAIRSIQEDFEKILVVTHIEELKGEFPVRIDVEKRDTGSRITVN